ncbi:MAG: hypothetical protein EOM20_12160 [Spartobacteria bacterium]|nr:hypothetical protein [Spartobacteria bacterium]
MTRLLTYRFSDKTGHAMYRRGQLMGLVPLLFSLMLIVSIPKGAGPGPWNVLGISAGFQLVLWGGYHLHTHRPVSAWGRALVEHSDRWYPAFLFGVRKVFLILFFVILWFCLTDLGYPSSPLLHLIFFMIVCIYPVRSVLREFTYSDPDIRFENAEIITHYLLIIMLILFIAVSSTHMAVPMEGPLTKSIPMTVVFIWIPAILVILSCVTLCLHRCDFQKENDSKPAAKTDDDPEQPVMY